MILSAHQAMFPKFLPYDAEVEYLQSPNTKSYIDLGIKTDSDYDFTIKLSVGTYKGNGCVFGVYYGTESRAQVLSAISFSTKRYGFTWDGYTSPSFTVDAFGFSSIDTIKLTPTQFVFNDKTYTRSRSVINPSDATLRLFDEGTGTRGGTIARIYYFVVAKNGSPILDLIPVRKGTVGYMYDQVSGKLFGNQGEGAFILGPDKVQSTVSAKSYIQDGLIAMWDGIENAGWGVHDANATAWKDLVGDCDLTLQGNAVFNDKGLFLDGASYAMREIDDSYWDTVGTLDVGVDKQSEGTFATIGGRSTDFAIIMLNKAYEGRNGVFYRRAMSAYGCGNGFRSVCRRGRYGNFNIFEDGLGLASDDSNWINPVVANAVFIGANSPTLRLMKGVVHCVRVYNRALTDAEIVHNYAVDKERFGL